MMLLREGAWFTHKAIEHSRDEKQSGRARWCIRECQLILATPSGDKHDCKEL